MKRSLFIAAIAVTATGISCNREKLCVPDSQLPETRTTVTFSLTGDAGIQTKAALSTSNEAKVNTVQIFAFKSDGLLDAYTSSTQSSGIQMQCSTGEKDFVAIVNAPDLSSVSGRDDLMKSATKLSDNSLTGFVMSGSVTATVSASANIEIPVKRIVARIGIGSITAEFKSSAYAAMDFIITRIYVINVAGNTDYEVTASPSDWYNKLKYEKSDLDAMLYDDITDTKVTKDKPYTTADYFYVYPNPTASDTQTKPFSARFTRLVIETTLGGTTYYYPISIGNIERNKTYTVSSLKVTRPGSTDPDIPVSSEDCTFSIRIEPWESGSDIDITI